MNLKKSRQTKDELGGGLMGAAARAAASRLTRRSLVCGLGYAAAAVMGAKFLIADGARAMATVKAGPTCFDAKNPCGTHGLLCGLSGGAVVCKEAFGSVGCPNCLQGNGCPKGSQPNQSWTGCCSCANGSASYTVQYTDCCSGSYTCNKLPPPCNTNGNNTCVCHSDCSANPVTDQWCNYYVDCRVSTGNNYVCTRVTPTSAKC